MKTKIAFSFLIGTFFLVGCDENPKPATLDKIEVVINDIPFQTEIYYRIPYTMKTW
jgi:uncharacterized protein YcfL